MSSPSRNICPSSMSSSRSTHRRRVDLPDPDVPDQDDDLMLGDVEVDAVEDPAVTVTLTRPSPKEPGLPEPLSGRRTARRPVGKTSGRHRHQDEQQPGNDVGREVVTRGHLDLRGPHRIHRTENRDQSAILCSATKSLSSAGVTRPPPEGGPPAAWCSDGSGRETSPPKAARDAPIRCPPGTPPPRRPSTPGPAPARPAALGCSGCRASRSPGKPKPTRYKQMISGRPRNRSTYPAANARNGNHTGRATFASSRAPVR